MAGKPKAVSPPARATEATADDPLDGSRIRYRTAEELEAEQRADQANAVRTMDVMVADDMPVAVRVRLECARIATKAAGHIGHDGIRRLAEEIEDFALNGGAARRD